MGEIVKSPETKFTSQKSFTFAPFRNQPGRTKTMRISRLLFIPILILLCLSAGSVVAQAPRRIQSITLDGRPLASFQYDKFKRLSRIDSASEVECCNIITQINYDRSGQLMSAGKYIDTKGSTPLLIEHRDYRLDIYNRIMEEKVERVDSVGRKIRPFQTRTFSYATRQDVFPNTEQVYNPAGRLLHEIIFIYSSTGATADLEMYNHSGRLLETQTLAFDPAHPMYHQNIPWILREWVCVKCPSPPVELRQTRYNEDGSEEHELYRYLTEYDAAGYPKRITVMDETNDRQFVFEFEYL